MFLDKILPKTKNFSFAKKKASINQVAFLDYKNLSVIQLSKRKNKIKIAPNKNISNKTPLVSNLSPKHMLKTNISIDKTIPQEVVLDYIQEEAYQEFGIQTGEEYAIYYRKLEESVDETKNEFDVYMYSNASITNIYKKCSAKYKYIDYIISDPFLYEILYKNNTLDSNDTEIFLDVGEDESYAHLYINGKIVYFQEIDIKFKGLYEIFANYLGDKIDYESFLENISIDPDKYDQNIQEGMQEITNYIKQKIDEVIVYINNTYTQESIQSVYMNSINHINKNIYKQISQDININCKKISLDFGFKTEEYINIKTQLCLLNALHYSNNKEDDGLANFTIYNRPLPLMQRDSGKAVAFGLLGLLMCGGYLGTIYIDIVMTKAKINQNRQKLIKIDKSLNSLKNELALIKKEQKELDLKLKTIKEDSQLYSNILDKIYSILDSRVQKSSILIDVVKSINSQNVKILSLNIQNANKDMDVAYRAQADINVIAKKNKDITNLLNTLGEAGYSIQTEEILKNKDNEFLAKLKLGVVR